jgi:hypothetical protein
LKETNGEEQREREREEERESCTGHGAHGAHERVDEAGTDGRPHVADVDGEAGGRALQLGVLAVGGKGNDRMSTGCCATACVLSYLSERWVLDMQMGRLPKPCFSYVASFFSACSL